MGITKKSYLELQLYKFARINKIRRVHKNHYYFKGVGVVILFQKDSVCISSIPFNLLGYSMSIQFTSFPELIYKLIKHRFLPVDMSDLKYKPFNYTQQQLNLFTEYEEKINELRKNSLIQLMYHSTNFYMQQAASNERLHCKPLKPINKNEKSNNIKQQNSVYQSERTLYG
jgi:hypothetical protein